MKRCNPDSFGCSNLLDLDKWIAGLVLALNYLKVKTYSSCQGHKERFYHDYPWVAISDNDYEKVKEWIEEYNLKSLKSWKLELNGPSKKWILRPSGRMSSGNLKEEAQLLAGFLWRKRVSE